MELNRLTRAEKFEETNAVTEARTDEKKDAKTDADGTAVTIADDSGFVLVLEAMTQMHSSETNTEGWLFQLGFNGRKRCVSIVVRAWRQGAGG